MLSLFYMNQNVYYLQWVEAREKFHLAADFIDAEQRMKKSMWGQFWSAHQRFFKYLCISAKVARCVQLARDAVKNGKVGARTRKGKEMFYLTTHSTHFIYGYMESDMVKDHSDSEKGNPLPQHRLLFPISSKGSFICITPQTGYYIPQPLLHQLWSTGWNEK